MKCNDINDYVPSILNPRTLKKLDETLTLTQNSITSRCSLSLRKNNISGKLREKSQNIISCYKETAQNEQNRIIEASNKNFKEKSDIEITSLGISALDDINTCYTLRNNLDSSFDGIEFPNYSTNVDNTKSDVILRSSATELDDNASDKTLKYEYVEKPVINVCFGINNSDSVDVTSKNSSIQKISITRIDNNTTFECEVVENIYISSESELDENMNETYLPSPPKKLAVAVNLEIKKKKLSNDIDNHNTSKFLILNTNAIDNISHVIVQPPNYKLLKRRIVNKNNSKSVKRKSSVFGVKDGRTINGLKQKSIDSYVVKSSDDLLKLPETTVATTCNIVADGQEIICNDVNEMSKNSSLAGSKCGRNVMAHNIQKNPTITPKSAKLPHTKNIDRQDIKSSISDAQRVATRKRSDSRTSQSPRKNIDTVQFSVASKSNKPTLSARHIPYYKIVAGTHFAVDAFAYGDIPNVNHYFLTHFHSDHYAGLSKKFSKLLFCSKITADLCISRLGVDPKHIHVINIDETIKIDSIEVTALDANHCPGSIMLVFTLSSGKTLLHTGDFRATPLMESYPVFWNKEIHTIYLDTTYCNPRYDFPTQDQSLEMALYILKQKKLAVEKMGKKFSSVLIVCGTYTIGKEKFFLGMARRVGCSVWACPEKDRVLQAVEGKSFGQQPPESCQLHVVPMRDLTLEKLRTYLESLRSTFNEVVAFKPSGWENGKNVPTVEKDNVTIYGIPYSEHSSFSELIRFVKYLKPKQVVPTVDISGGAKSVQKYFPCPIICKEDMQNQGRLTDYFSIQNRAQTPAVT